MFFSIVITLSLDHSVASIYTHQLPGDVVTFIRGEKNKGRRYVLRFCEPFEQNTVHIDFFELLIGPDLFGHVCCNNSQ